MNGQYSPQRFNLLPPVVKNLLIINGLFFLATLTFSDVEMIKILALHYPGSENFSPYQYVTYLFMHGSFGHLFFNMFALWMFGYALENVWGSKRFLTYFMITGIGAALLQTIINWIDFSAIKSAIASYETSPTPDAFIALIREHFEGLYLANKQSIAAFMERFRSAPESPALIQESFNKIDRLMELKMNIPTVGASGAVYGILLAFGMLFPNVLVYIWFLIPLKAKYLVMIFGAIELYAGFSANAGDNVAHFAHLGGMIFGFLLIKLWRNKMNRDEFL